MHRALIAILLTTILIHGAEARMIIPFSKQESTSFASMVAKVEIVKSTPLMVGERACAYEYEAKVISVMKGTLPRATPFRFGVFGSLEVGKKYVIYLRNLETKSEFVHIMEEQLAAIDITYRDTAHAFFEACPLLPPIPMYFRSDRVSNE